MGYSVVSLCDEGVYGRGLGEWGVVYGLGVDTGVREFDECGV